MALLKKIKRAVRGEVKLTTAALEALRRARVSAQQRQERANLAKDHDAPATLSAQYSRMSEAELLEHFRGACSAKFFPGFLKASPSPPAELIPEANRIVDDHCWPLLGFGEQSFGKA